VAQSSKKLAQPLGSPTHPVRQFSIGTLPVIRPLTVLMGAVGSGPSEHNPRAIGQGRRIESKAIIARVDLLQPVAEEHFGHP
jgi:hypothetical protein